MSWSEVGEIASGHHLPQILAGLGFGIAPVDVELGKEALPALSR
jgi:hypothetical protein